MNKNICVVELPGERNFAVIYPGNILFGLDATEQELNELVQEATNTIPDKGCNLPRGASLGIIVTFDCNLRCEYCYARGGESKEIVSLEVAKIALDTVRRQSDGSFLNLFLVGGGEPLLHFFRVVEIVDYAKTLFEKVQVNVVSNGTFDVNVRNWLAENKANIRISFDGIRQNEQRPFESGAHSYEKVVENIRALVASGIDVIVQCIITAEGLNTINDTIDLVVSLGVQGIKIEPALATDVSRATSSLEPNPQKYARALLNAIRHIANKEYKLTVDTGFFAEPSEEFYCGMPDSNKVITPHGLVTACVEVARPTDPFANKILYGEVKDQMILDLTKQGELKKLHFNNQLGGCSTCNLRLICHGGCPMANIWRNGLPIRKSQYTCAIQHALLPELLLLIAGDDRIAPIVIEEVERHQF